MSHEKETTKKQKKHALNKAADDHVFVKKSIDDQDHEETLDDAAYDHADDGLEKTAKKDRRDVDAALADIYKDSDGTLPDMSRITKGGRRQFLRAFVTFLFACGFLATAVWIGLFVIQPQSGFSEKDIIITISGDEEVQIGDEVHYRIRYVNAQDIALSQASIQVRYPEGFLFTESSVAPDSDRNDQWTIGTLAAQESGYIDVYGTLYGSKDQEQSLRVFFTYTPENFSSAFQKVSTVTVSTKKTPFAIEVAGPTASIAGGQHSFTVTVDRSSDDALATPVMIEVVPDGVFIKKESTPASDQFTDFRWTIPAGEKHFQLTLQGSIVSDADATITIPVRVIGWKDDNKNVDPYIFEEYQYTLALVKEDVVVSAVMNGGSESVSVQPGETLNVSVSLRNAGESALEDIQIQAVFDAPSYANTSILSWNELQDSADGDIRGEQLNETMRRGVISWNKRHITPLTRIGPHDEQIIDVAIPIRNAEQTALANFSTFQGRFTVDVQYSVNGKLQTMSSKPITFTINSDLSLDVRDQIGNDQGKETHTITWVVENNFHELKDISIAADVYGDTILDEASMQVPAGATQFDKEKKRLTWHIDTMPLSVDVLPLQFRLIRNTANPSQTQLMSKVELRAKDTVTGQDMILVGDEILLKQQ